MPSTRKAISDQLSVEITTSLDVTEMTTEQLKAWNAMQSAVYALQTAFSDHPLPPSRTVAREGLQCGSCGSGIFADTGVIEDADELMAVHMLAYHPGKRWMDRHGKTHEPGVSAVAEAAHRERVLKTPPP